MTAILIVDDESTVRLALRLVLDAAGYDVEEASAPPQALEILGRKKIDLVLTDLALPHGGGERVVVAAKEAEPTRPVLVITGGGLSAGGGGGDPLVRARKSGADMVMVKPVAADHLLQSVAALLAPGRS